MYQYRSYHVTDWYLIPDSWMHIVVFIFVKKQMEVSIWANNGTLFRVLTISIKRYILQKGSRNVHTWAQQCRNHIQVLWKSVIFFSQKNIKSKLKIWAVKILYARRKQINHFKGKNKPGSYEIAFGQIVPLQISGRRIQTSLHLLLVHLDSRNMGANVPTKPQFKWNY